MPVLTLPPQHATSLPTQRAKALVFDDPRSQALLTRVEQIAPSEATVLVIGETGTGKEIIARHIHALSRRANERFVAVNCGAFAENLVESELFGHEKGAFTGALQSKPGWFEAANGGTLFLDEVGDLPLSVQVKLLRVLQENEVVRLGSRRAIPVNVRLVAATNVDLREAMWAGHFREDLYYRLDVVRLALLPLRERPLDVEPLARHFLEQFQRRMMIERVELSPAALDKLINHSWPGNIRELENAIHHALLVCNNALIAPEDLRLNPLSAPGRRQSSSPPSTPPPSNDVVASNLDAGSSQQAGSGLDPFQALEQVFQSLFELPVENLHERVEEALLRSAYWHCEHNQLQTARLLGISRNVVRARLIQFGALPGPIRNPGAEALLERVLRAD